MKKHLPCFLSLLILASLSAFAADPASDEAAPAEAAPPAPAAAPSPTLANLPYGDHPREVLDFWKANSATPTPLVIFMHGGGWVKGDKKDVIKASLTSYLDAGISVVSFNYRFTTMAQLAGVNPPVQWPMEDAVRLLQFVRSKAAEWNINPQRIALTGGSAGACTSLWLAFQPDMADPKSPDPIARQSTRVAFVAVSNAQTTLDPQLMKEWIPNSVYGGGAFGLMDPNNIKTRDTRFAEFLTRRDEFLPAIKKYSPLEQATADDPPVYLSYTTTPALGQPQKNPTHSANFGVKLKEKLDALGVPCELVYPGSPDVKHPDVSAFLIEKLKS